MDPLQFAYRAKRGVEDATLTLINLIVSHLDTAGNTVRVLFMDFSSAFNTIQPHILIQRLVQLDVNNNLIFWIREFLCDRPQRVSLSTRLFGHSVLSDEIVLNTGAPQGCVLSPVLFSIYTNNMFLNDPILSLIKYADDMALVGRLKDEETLSKYFTQVDLLNEWFKSSFLQLNVGKTKEMIFGGKSDVCSPKVVRICDKEVELVETFKYLGVSIDNKLTFSDHVHAVYTKAQQRLFLLRKLKYFNVNQSVMELVYRSLIESILTFNIVTWYGTINVKNKAKLHRIVATASKIVGQPQRQLTSLYQAAMKRTAIKIVRDPIHPLNPCFEILPSGKRYKVPLARKNLFKKSFLPSAITILNSSRIT